ncbi:hypothetical protein M8J77_010678 [Diaphorina citri]|nr:hypothetical protein M8J77_010678 [Diaphorina citri]
MARCVSISESQRLRKFGASPTPDPKRTTPNSKLTALTQTSRFQNRRHTLQARIITDTGHGYTSNDSNMILRNPRIPKTSRCIEYDWIQ